MFLDDIDGYVDMLYDENVESKLKGSISVLYLCLSIENMEYMINHESLLPVLGRTLSDDHKKSLDLSLYLLNVFYAYSNFTQFH